MRSVIGYALFYTLRDGIPDADPSASRSITGQPDELPASVPVLAVDIGGTGGYGSIQYVRKCFNDYANGGAVYDGLIVTVGRAATTTGSRA